MSLSFFSNSQLYYSVSIADFQGKIGLKLFFGKDENWKKKNLDSKLFFIKLPSKTTQDYVSVRTRIKVKQ